MRGASIKKGTVLYKASVVATGGIATQVVGFGYRIIISNLCGAETVGVYSLIMGIYSVISALSLTGITLGISRRCSELVAVDKKENIFGTVRVGQKLFLIMFTITAIPCAVFSKPISQVIIGSKEGAMGIVIILPCLLLTGMENTYKACFYGTGKVIYPTVSEFAEQIVRCGSVYALIIGLQPKTPEQKTAVIAMGMVISEIFSSVFLHILFKNQFKKTSYRPSRKYISQIAVPVSASGVLSAGIGFLNTALIPKCLVYYGMSSKDAVAEYGRVFGMAMPIAVFAAAFLTPINTVLVPKYAWANAICNSSYLKRKSGKAIHFTGIIGFFALGLLVFFSNPIADCLYPGQNIGGILPYLGVIGVCGYYQMALCGLLNGLGKQKFTSLVSVVTGIVSVALISLLVCQYGIQGYIISAIVISGFTLFMYGKAAIKLTLLSVKANNWITRPLVATIISIGIAKLVYCYAAGNVWVYVGLGLFIYLALLRLWGNDIFGYIKKSVVNY